MFLYPYKMGSESATNLAGALGIKQIRHENSKFKGGPDKVVINWGASKLPEEVMKSKVINSPEAVAKAADKLLSFKAMARAGVSIPPFTESFLEARDWATGGDTVVCRTVLNGHSGEGIVLTEPGNEPVNAPLYVKYIPKKQEYRVHCGYVNTAGGNKHGSTLFVQRKSRRKDVADNEVNWKIRNHGNGFIFAQGEDLGVVPEDVITQAHAAVLALGLDFGAVDVIYNEKQAKAFVLEVNTAPGITGQSIEHYAEFFEDVANVRPIKKQAYAKGLNEAWNEAILGVIGKAILVDDVGLR